MIGSLFGKNDDDDYEEVEEREDYILEREFVRKTVEFKFIRGETETITFDDVGERVNSSYGSFNDGRKIDHRGDIRVERFVKVVGGNPHSFNGHVYLRFDGEETGNEITTQNVTSRNVKKEEKMKATLPVYDNVTIRSDTGEEVKRSIVPRKQNPDDEVEITKCENVIAPNE